MIKLFIIQVFIALIILASSLTPSGANAAAISRAASTHQDHEQRAALSTASTADNEKRLEFTRDYESPITDYSDSAPVSAPVMARQVDGFHLQARKITLNPKVKAALDKVGNFFKKIFGISSGAVDDD